MKTSISTLLPLVNQHRIVFIIMFISMILVPHQVNCAPMLRHGVTNSEEAAYGALAPLESNLRTKRSGISDQRLAELETLLALKRMRDEHLKNRMVAFGLFDPEQIGRRRRRSSSEEYERPSLYERLQKPDRYNQLQKK